MGSRFDKSPSPFASIASRIEPSSLRNQIPRNGGRFLFPMGVDSLMLTATGDILRQYADGRIQHGSISTKLLESLQLRLENQSRDSSSVTWGAGTRNALESQFPVSESNLRSNCGVTRALLAGLISPDDTSEPICSATHTHVTAVQGAKLIARAVEVAVKEERLFSEIDVDSSMAHYKKLVPKAVDLATGKEYNEEDEFTTDLQDRFRARFGLDASSQCAVASTIFALHRTVHSLPYLNAASEEYQERILTVARAGMEKEKRGVAMNVLGNSNRLDTALLFSKLTPSIEQDLPVAIAVGWAISLGGDVRSNACLAGGLAGALWGEQGIPDEWLMFSEGIDEARHLADDLFSKSVSSS